MNNLNDISQDDEYADALGFTKEEMKFFAPEIEDIVKYRVKKGEKATTSSEINGIRDHYDGYKFTAEGPPMFHPSFLMIYLTKKKHSAVKGKIPEPKYLFDLLPKRLHSPRFLTGINTTEDEIQGLTDPKHLELAPLLFHTGIFSIKRYDPHSDTYFLHYPNKYMAKFFEDQVFKELLDPFTPRLDYKRFGDKCIEMVGDLLKGDEHHVRKYFDQLNIIAMEIGYSTLPHDFSGNIQDSTKENLTKQEYYFKLEGAFQLMIQLCLDVTKIGQVRNGRQFSHGRGDIEFQIPKQSKTILYETKAGVGDVRGALNQLLSLYAGAYLNKKMTLVCISVSFSKETRKLEDWIYAEYDEKGTLLNFFSQKGNNVETMNLHNISIS
jgi:hypothetical protein